VQLAENVPLAPRCTLELGGAARYLCEARSEADVASAVAWAEQRGLPLRVLGGGSNLVIADDGLPGLVLSLALRGIEQHASGDKVELTAAAGEPWDGLVEHSVKHGLSGLECLSGIPGLVGATPIQNVGAYGQEVAETITRVRVLDRESRAVRVLSATECGFSYRDSVFKSVAPERYVVLAVSYALTPGGRPCLRYPELQKQLAPSASLTDAREVVLRTRRAKSMVIDPNDVNRRSCGSFFVNPVLSAEELAAVETRLGNPEMPRWPAPLGRTKLSAAWLIERSGLERGLRMGNVGLSSKHALALVCHDGARARDVVAFARRITATVREHSGVELVPEPVFWGFSRFEGALPAD
jgi:UDP-N-acetylmuramate dehydrogenase